MSYYKLKNICVNYNEPSTGLTCNRKYINPYIENSDKIALYDTNNFTLNSYEYLNNNSYPQTKSYNSFDKSYEHYISKLLNKRDQLIAREEKLIREKEKKLLKEEEIIQKHRKELKDQQQKKEKKDKKEKENQ